MASGEEARRRRPSTGRLRVALKSVEELENPELSEEDGVRRFVLDGVEN